MIATKTIFSHGTFQLDVRIDESYTEPDFAISINSIDLYEYDPQSSNTSDPYELLEDAKSQAVDGGAYMLYKFSTQKNRLVKWVVKIDPTIITNNGTITLEKPCCAYYDGEFYVFEGYAVDLTQYKLETLDAIKLQCHDCEVPRDLLNRLLKIFAIEAAAESRSPYLEMIFSKLACGKKYNKLVSSFSRNCNCNG